MNLKADDENATITVTLEAGETLGNLTGPTVASVPRDLANAEYAAIHDARLPVATTKAKARPR
jgi:hypothetical protein